MIISLFVHQEGELSLKVPTKGLEGEEEEGVQVIDLEIRCKKKTKESIEWT